MAYIETPYKIEDYVNAIGQITIQQSLLEDAMADSIGVLIGEDESANIRITASEPFLNLLRLLAVLFKYRITDKNQIKRFDIIAKNLKDSDTARNVNIHAAIILVEFSDKTIVFKNRYSKFNIANFEIDDTPPTIEALNKIALNIRDGRSDLRNIVKSNISIIRRHQSNAIKLTRALNKAKNQFQQKQKSKIV
jgi:hypothetical protein